jgi:hypothetical protein
MAPTLAESQHVMIEHMIPSKSVKSVDIAAAAGCSDRSVRAIRANMRCFGSTRAPFNGAGRPRLITPVMLDALRQKLLEKPGMYLDEVASRLIDALGVQQAFCSPAEPTGLFGMRDLRLHPIEKKGSPQ